MNWHSIINFLERDKKSIDEIINELENKERGAASIIEYITVKYNKCVLLDYSLNIHENGCEKRLSKTEEFVKLQKKFLENLNELNKMVFSRFWDDSNCDDLFFYYAGLLNFKVHNYDLTLKMLSKSIKLEKNISNNDIYFHKRCLKAYCLEYIGLELNDSKYLGEAIKFLIGYDVFNQTINQQDIADLIEKIMEYANQNIALILDSLCSIETDSVYNSLKYKYEAGHINKAIYNKYLNEIAHILSHCFSEVRKSENYKRQHKEHILFLRIANILMQELGEEYVTCLATLKIENGEYFSALSTLLKRRKELESKNNVKYANKQIAIIDFYYWYFSVLAKRNVDGVFFKKEFYNYCLETYDPVAIVYYNILNLKENLIKYFDAFRQNNEISDSLMEDLEKQYSDFLNVSPGYSIHRAIAEEWDFLKYSYDIFKLCRDINAKTPLDISFYKLCSNLFTKYNNSCEFVRYDIRNEENIALSSKAYVFKLSSGAQIICQGTYETFYSAFLENEINLMATRPININNEKIISNILSQNISNILIKFEEDNVNECLYFVEAILDFDSSALNKIDQHNVFVDLSALGLTLQNEIMEKINKLVESDEEMIHYIPNVKTVTLLGSMFAMLENHIFRLNKPMDSYVISPISDDVTYDGQASGSFMYLVSNPDKHNNVVEYLDLQFSTLYSSFNNGVDQSKVLLVDKFIDYINYLDYIFYFKALKNNNNDVNCYAFDFNSVDTQRDKYIYSDANEIEGMGLRTNEVITAIKQLIKHVKSYPTQKCHMDSCSRQQCCNSFQFTHKDLKEFKSLRAYLYSYVGIMLKERSFLVIKNSLEDNSSNWIVVVLKNCETRDKEFELSLCKTLLDPSSYIKNINILEDEETGISNINRTQELINRIKPVTSGNKYIFVSYRGKENTPQLCLPVYNDVIQLQEKLSNSIDVMIDKKNFKDYFDENIIDAINDDNCVGSIIYLSSDYMCPTKIDDKGNQQLKPIKEDRCFKEVECLLAKKQKNSSFFIYIVFIGERSKDEGYLSIIKKSFRKLLDLKDKDRINCYYNLLGLETEVFELPEDINTVGIICYDWQENLDHFKKNENWKNSLRSLGYDWDEI